MSTIHHIIQRDRYMLEVAESSALAAFEIWKAESGDDGDADPVDSTPAIFTDEDLLKAAVELVRVASYISSEPETVVRRLMESIHGDDYLGCMDSGA